MRDIRAEYRTRRVALPSAFGGTRASDLEGRRIPPLADERAASHAVGRIVVIQRDSIDDLRGLRPPSELGSLNARWIALLDQGADELERVGLSLAHRKGHVAQDYVEKASILFQRAGVLVREQGMTSCRGPALGPV